MARGDRTGVLITLVASAANTVSKAATNFESRSRITNLKRRPLSPREVARFRACWVVHRLSGWAVTPARKTWRRSSSMKNRTDRRRRLTVSTVKKSQASTPDAWVRKNSIQVGPPRRGVGRRWWRRKTLRTEDTQTPTPTFAHSPAMRT